MTHVLTALVSFFLLSQNLPLEHLLLVLPLKPHIDWTNQLVHPPDRPCPSQHARHGLGPPGLTVCWWLLEYDGKCWDKGKARHQRACRWAIPPSLGRSREGFPKEVIFTAKPTEQTCLGPRGTEQPLPTRNGKTITL